MPLRFVLEGIVEIVLDVLVDLAETATEWLCEKVFGSRRNHFSQTAGGRNRVPLKSRLKIYPPDKVDTPAQIIEQPAPVFTKASIRSRKPGVVRLKAILGKDGRIKNIQPLQGLDNQLTKAAIKAARQLRFQPARIGGFPVSQWVELEYRFDDK